MGLTLTDAIEPSDRLSPAERQDVGDLVRQIEVVSESSPALGSIAAAMGSLIPGLTVLFRPTLTDHGWNVEYLHGAGGDATGRQALRARFLDVLATAPRLGPIATFNPLWIERSRRNRVIMADAYAPSETSLHVIRHMAPLLGQSRVSVLLCDGPWLLGSVGAYQREPYRERDKELLETLVEPLRRRLRFERMLLQRACPWEAFEHVLDSIEMPAFIVRRGATIDHANAAGARWLDGGTRELFDILARTNVSGNVDDFQVERLELGTPGCCWGELVTLRPGGNAVRVRAMRAEQEWHLSKRESEVLLLVAEGLSNKDIAARWGLSLKTIEWHVSGLLKKARTESRTQIVARFWQL